MTLRSPSWPALVFLANIGLVVGCANSSPVKGTGGRSGGSMGSGGASSVPTDAMPDATAGSGSDTQARPDVGVVSDAGAPSDQADQADLRSADSVPSDGSDHSDGPDPSDSRSDASPIATDAAPATPSCPLPPYFEKFPIALSEIEHISVLGGFSPPGHTLPTDHLGVYLKSKGIPFAAPGPLHLWNLRRVTYVISPWRQGETDYAIEFKLCDTVVGIFGHLPSVSDRLAGMFQQPHCDRYSTSDETVEACVQQNIAGVDIASGELIGTVGGPSAGAFDFDLYDYNHMNAFVNPDRSAFLNRHAICGIEQFSSVDREFLLSHVSPDGQRWRTDEPRCGTMDIDIAGSPQGIWVTKSNPVNQMGDETAFISLALDPGQPSDHLALSAGASGLGARLYRFPRLHTGRVNRDYREISTDGVVYCFDGDPNVPTTAILLSLNAANELTLERVEATQGTSACTKDAASWTFGPSAITYVR